MSRKAIIKGVISALVTSVIFCVYISVNPILENSSINDEKGKKENVTIKHKTFSQNQMQSYIKPANEIIHIATIIIGKDFFNYGLVLIKSIVFTTKKKVYFYIYTTDDAVDKILVETQAWPKEFKSRINIYKLEAYKGSDLHFPAWTNPHTSWKILAYASIMSSPIITEHTSKLIYMDADLFALDDLWKLWQVFNTFDRNQTVAAKSKLGFNVPFNSQGHIGTGPQHCHLWDSNPQR